MGFDMRARFNPVLIAIGLETVNIGFGDIKINEHSRRINFGEHQGVSISCGFSATRHGRKSAAGTA